MLNAFKALGYVIVLAGVILTVLTIWFALGFILRILAFLVAILGVLFILGFVVWSWWTECIVDPYIAKRNLKRKKKDGISESKTG